MQSQRSTPAPPSSPALEVAGLCFRYPGSPSTVLVDLSFALPRGARCLLLGANGTGKSTLLRLLAGRHMIAAETVRVLGRPAFQDTRLAHELAFLGGDFPFRQDITVAEILRHRPGVDPARRQRLLALLDVDPEWRMSRVSDGQRRRVQILLDLERTLSLLLVDEVTAELDVLARAELLRFLAEESRSRGLTVVYASHVLDGLEAWGSHLIFLGVRRLRYFGPLAPVIGSGLAELCERWMAEDRIALRS
jgi:CCR4-NOT complex subunit CAF16